MKLLPNRLGFNKGRALALPLLLLSISSFTAYAGEPVSFSKAITTNNQASESQSVIDIQASLDKNNYKQAIKIGEKQFKHLASGKIALYLGKAYFLDHNYANALKYFDSAADDGEPLAMLTLGNMYGSGTGTPQDVNQAISWYQKAVAKGNVQAMNYLGLIYRDGVGATPINPKQAISLFNQAALKRDAQGYFNLGFMYQNGLGVKVDYKTAIAYYTQASNLGDVKAMNNLGNIYSKGVGVAVDNVAALKWYTLAAAKGDATAQCNIGIIYFDGKGVTKNMTLAKSWLLLGQKSGCTAAAPYLAQIPLGQP